MRPLFVAAIVVLGSLTLLAQDAVKTLPDNYKVTFENEFVRVTRVHYPPHAKLPGHTHTSLPTAYVYLNDGGPVAFKHIGLEYGAVTRPATVARSYRLFRGLEEIHEVENLSETPSEFLRVEFKTDPGPDPRTLRGKILPPPTADADESQKMEFENAQIRVTRLRTPASTPLTVEARPHPAVLISLVASEMGKARWLPKGTPLSGLTHDGAFEGLLFELKSSVKTTH
jgi:hypothetical protein